MAVAYAENSKVRVVIVAGSTGRGTADAYSDLEIDIYYDEPPTEEDRVAAVERCGAKLLSLDHDEIEWEEQMSFDGFPAATSTFLVSTMERFISEVVDDCNPDVEAQMRLYSVQHAVPVVGSELAEQWRQRVANYPDGLVHAMLDGTLGFWRLFRNVDMIVARDDLIALTDGIVDVQKRLLRALFALNRVYLPIPEPIKRLDEVVDELQIKPDRLAARLRGMLRAQGEDAVSQLESLIEEVLDLVGENCKDFDVDSCRDELVRVRKAWESPS